MTMTIQPTFAKRHGCLYICLASFDTAWVCCLYMTRVRCLQIPLALVMVMLPKSSVSTISYGSHASLSSYGSYALPLQYYGFYAYYIAFISRLYQLLFLLILLLLYLLHHDSFRALSRPAVHLWINLWFRDLAHQCSFLVCILLRYRLPPPIFFLFKLYGFTFFPISVLSPGPLGRFKL